MSGEHIAQLLSQAPEEKPPCLKSVGLLDFLNMDLPERKMLLSPWLPEAGLCMIHAIRGVGKTYIALSIGYAVAFGKKLFHWVAPEARDVLYIDGEMPAVVLQERLAAMVNASGDQSLPGKFNFITPDLQDGYMPDLSTVEGQMLVEQHITESTALIIIDNLSCLASGVKENDSFDWTPLQKWALSLRRRKISVLFIHHSGKGGFQRGTSKREDVLDTVICLERPKDYEPKQGSRFTVKYEKARGFFGYDAKEFEAQLCEDEDGKSAWKTTWIEDSTYQKVVSMYNDGMEQQEIAVDLEINKSTVSRHMKRARQEGLITRSD